MKRPADEARDRAAHLAEIRRQIAAGTYETPERLSAAVDALLEDLEDREKSAETGHPF
ncbi:MAG: hypothetical protein HYX69_17095 [Planctomycetia bacterium]|nr:hypothetical protein [Planctomycetia bacterium]